MYYVFSKILTSSQNPQIFSFYRQLQLVEKQMNATLAPFFTPGSLTFCSIGIIFTLYVVIKLHVNIPMPGFAFFPMLLTDILLVVGVDFASLGKMYGASKSFVEPARKLTNSTKLVRRSAMALQPLKIRFGMNFIDELTALTILDFCLNQTVSLILMT